MDSEEDNGYKLLKKKLYDFFSTIRACRVLLPTSSVKVCDLMCRLLGKKFSFVGITISVHVLNKSRGSEMFKKENTYMCVIFKLCTI